MVNNRTLRAAALAGLWLAPALAHAQQTSLATGPATVKLKLINTISGAGNANVLYGTSAPGDSKLFLVQQGTTGVSGKVLYVNPTVVNSPVGTLLDFNTALPTALDTTQFEKGLLGLAFHPDFSDSAKPGYLKFYTYSNENRAFHATLTGIASGNPDFIHPETATSPTTLINNLAVLREWTANSTTPTGVTGASRIVMKIADPQSQHNGGTLAFSPKDGYLYWALGDGGGNSSNSPDFVGAINSATDGHTNSVTVGSAVLPHGNGQDRTNPLGDMLRINPLPASVSPDANATDSANHQYQIPTDNPFTQASNINPNTGAPYVDWNAGWVDEIYAYGLRNPYRFSFDPGSGPLDPQRGTLYLNDAGYDNREEIDVINRGNNYGWVIREGTEPMQGTLGIPAYTAPMNAATGLPDTLTDPIGEYFETVGTATIGGFVYRGSPDADLTGKYVFGDNSSPLTSNSGLLMYIDLNEAKAPATPFTIRRLAISGSPASPTAGLLGFGRGAGGEIFAMFDNGGVYQLLSLYTADFDADGDVDAADLTRWKGAIGANANADADNDGDSDGEDFLAWQRQLGAAVSVTQASGSVPEPAALSLLTIAIVAAFVTRRRSLRAVYWQR